MGVGYFWTKAEGNPVCRRMWTGEFTCAQKTWLTSQVGPHFSSKWGGTRQDRQFPSLISEHYKQWSYLSIRETKAASGKGMGAFSAGNVSLPRGTCEDCHEMQNGGATQTDRGLPFCQRQNVQRHWGIPYKAPYKQPLPCTTRESSSFPPPSCSTDHCYAQAYTAAEDERKSSENGLMDSGRNQLRTVVPKTSKTLQLLEKHSPVIVG